MGLMLSKDLRGSQVDLGQACTYEHWTQTHSEGCEPGFYKGWERESLNWVYGHLFGIDFMDAYIQWNMRDYKCCGECVVAKRAIERIPRCVYEEMEARISNTSSQPWGWAMESVWENLFNGNLIHAAQQKARIGSTH